MFHVKHLRVYSQIFHQR